MSALGRLSGEKMRALPASPAKVAAILGVFLLQTAPAVVSYPTRMLVAATATLWRYAKEKYTEAYPAVPAGSLKVT